MQQKGGPLIVPDVLVRQHGSEGLFRTSVKQSALCSRQAHLFSLKTIRGLTAGSLSLLLKAVWGLLRNGPDTVIYSLFAE